MNTKKESKGKGEGRFSKSTKATEAKESKEKKNSSTDSKRKTSS